MKLNEQTNPSRFIISKNKSSFTEKIVDNYVDMINEF
jgi:hypothetical protein